MTRKECITNLFLLGFKQSDISRDTESTFYGLHDVVSNMYFRGDTTIQLNYHKYTFANGYTSKYIGGIVPNNQSFTTYTKLIDNVIERLK